MPKRPIITDISPEEDAEIMRGIEADPDAHEVTDEEWYAVYPRPKEPKLAPDAPIAAE